MLSLRGFHKRRVDCINMFYSIATIISMHALIGCFLVMTRYYFLVMSKHVSKTYTSCV